MVRTRQPILTRIIATAAERLALDPRIPAENREAYRQTAESVMHAQFSLLFGGERIYAPRESTFLRQQRNRRIEAALGSGEPLAAIASREQVSVRWVRAVRARLAERLMP